MIESLLCLPNNDRKVMTRLVVASTHHRQLQNRKMVSRTYTPLPTRHPFNIITEDTLMD